MVASPEIHQNTIYAHPLDHLRVPLVFSTHASLYELIKQWVFGLRKLLIFLNLKVIRQFNTRNNSFFTFGECFRQASTSGLNDELCHGTCARIYCELI